MTHKKIFFAISLLLSKNLLAPGFFEHHGQAETATSTITTSTSHITTSATGVSASSELITVLQDIASSLSSSANAAALTTILQQINAGVTVLDISILEQALQEALGILASGSPLNAFTVIEYTGILVGTLTELEAARAQAAASATSTVLTATTH